MPRSRCASATRRSTAPTPPWNSCPPGVARTPLPCAAGPAPRPFPSPPTPAPPGAAERTPHPRPCVSRRHRSRPVSSVLRGRSMHVTRDQSSAWGIGTGGGTRTRAPGLSVSDWGPDCRTAPRIFMLTGPGLRHPPSSLKAARTTQWSVGSLRSRCSCSSGSLCCSRSGVPCARPIPLVRCDPLSEGSVARALPRFLEHFGRASGYAGGVCLQPQCSRKPQGTGAKAVTGSWKSGVFFGGEGLGSIRIAVHRTPYPLPPPPSRPK